MEEKQKQQLKANLIEAIKNFEATIRQYEEGKGGLTLQQKQDLMSELAKCEANVTGILQTVESDERTYVLLGKECRTSSKTCARRMPLSAKKSSQKFASRN